MNEVVAVEVVEEENPIMITGERAILSPEVMQFATLVANKVGLTEAYRLAFPGKKHYKNIGVYAYQLAKNPKIREQISIIQEAVRLQIVAETPAALSRLIDLSENAESEKVRLDACRDLLDRGGLKPPSRVESIHVGLFGSASAEDLRQLIRNKLESETK